MWVADLPALDEELRQGDLIVGVPFPRVGLVQMTANGLAGPTDAAVTAVVLDHCCTVEQKHVVLLARVKNQGLNARMIEGLTNVDSRIGTYSRYLHLLDPHPSIPTKAGKAKVINLLDRVQLIGGSMEDLAWLRTARAARMTIVSRAHLRQKLAVHFGRAEEDDLERLAAQGLDSFGRPEPAVHRGFSAE